MRATRSMVLHLVSGAIAATLTVALARPALADESLVIKESYHPEYSLELEPHLVVGFSGPFGHDTVFGPGVRATFPILQDGFLKRVNDSVGIGVGADFARVGHDETVVAIPVVMQWNFWLSTHWTVFGEPGIDFATGSGRHDRVLDPIIAVGGRYHFSESVALTMRAGYPGVSVGASFFF